MAQSCYLFWSNSCMPIAILNLRIWTKRKCQFTWFLQFVSNSINFPQQKFNPRKLAGKKNFFASYWSDLHFHEGKYVWIERGKCFVGRKEISSQWFFPVKKIQARANHHVRWQSDNLTIWRACSCKAKFLSKFGVKKNRLGVVIFFTDPTHVQALITEKGN